MNAPVHTCQHRTRRSFLASAPKFKCCRDSRFVTLTHAFLGEVDMMHRIKEAMTKVPAKKGVVFFFFFGAIFSDKKKMCLKSFQNLFFLGGGKSCRFSQQIVHDLGFLSQCVTDLTQKKKQETKKNKSSHSCLGESGQNPPLCMPVKRSFSTVSS